MALFPVQCVQRSFIHSYLFFTCMIPKTAGDVGNIKLGTTDGRGFLRPTLNCYMIMLFRYISLLLQ